METIYEPETSIEKSRVLPAVLFGSLLAGTLDLAAAFISNGVRGGSPMRVLQAIASGLVGTESFTGGAATATLGVLLHFTIAFGATVIFYIASRRTKFLTAQPIVSGVLYGIAVYLLMYYAVVPLSAVPFKMQNAPGAIVIDILIHIFCVGLPIALVVRRFSK